MQFSTTTEPKPAVETTSPSTSSLGPLLDELESIARATAAIDVRRWEEADSPLIYAVLVPTVRELTQTAWIAFGQVFDRYEPGDGGDGGTEQGTTFYQTLDLLSSGGGERQVADLAFVARLELEERARLVDRLGPSTEVERSLAICDGSLRRLRKALAAIERAVAMIEGEEPRLRYDEEVDVARRIRGEYGRLREAVGSEPPTEATEVEARLRRCATAIARLTGTDVWPDVRIGDRFELRRFQRRLQSWLSRVSGDGSRPVREGVELWEDFNAFVGLLAGVNQREELVESDRRLVGDVLAELDELADDDADAVGDGLLSRLAHLLGRDERIDDLLAPPATRDVATWRRLLVRLDRDLAAEAGGGSIPPTEIVW